MSDARGEVLSRLRRALGPAPGAAPVPRRYRGPSAAADVVELFCARVAEYGAVLRRSSNGGLAGDLAGLCAERGLRRLVRAPGLELAIAGAELRTDEPPLPAAQLDAADGAVTGCALAVAETGTLVLDGSPACGRRALTLVPDLHLCIVRADQVVASLPDAIAALRPAATRPLTMISGPSATSDIEFRRVEGVHGPRTLLLVLVE